MRVIQWVLSAPGRRDDERWGKRGVEIAKPSRKRIQGDTRRLALFHFASPGQRNERIRSPQTRAYTQILSAQILSNGFLLMHVYLGSSPHDDAPAPWITEDSARRPVRRSRDGSRASNAHHTHQGRHMAAIGCTSRSHCRMPSAVLAQEGARACAVWSRGGRQERDKTDAEALG